MFESAPVGCLGNGVGWDRLDNGWTISIDICKNDQVSRRWDRSLPRFGGANRINNVILTGRAPLHRQTGSSPSRPSRSTDVGAMDAKPSRRPAPSKVGSRRQGRDDGWIMGRLMTWVRCRSTIPNNPIPTNTHSGGPHAHCHGRPGLRSCQDLVHGQPFHPRAPGWKLGPLGRWVGGHRRGLARAAGIHAPPGPRRRPTAR